MTNLTKCEKLKDGSIVVHTTLVITSDDLEKMNTNPVTPIQNSLWPPESEEPAAPPKKEEPLEELFATPFYRIDKRFVAFYNKCLENYGNEEVDIKAEDFKLLRHNHDIEYGCFLASVKNLEKRGVLRMNKNNTGRFLGFKMLIRQNAKGEYVKVNDEIK